MTAKVLDINYLRAQNTSQGQIIVTGFGTAVTYSPNVYVLNNKIGVGSTSPTKEISVVGNIAVFGAGNGFVFSDGSLQTTAVAGGATTSVTDTASLFNSTAAAAAFTATKSLTTALNYYAVVKGIVDTNATTGGNIFLSYLASAGTATPLRGSYFKVTRLPTGNVGTFT